MMTMLMRITMLMMTMQEADEHNAAVDDDNADNDSADNYY